MPIIVAINVANAITITTLSFWVAEIDLRNSKLLLYIFSNSDKYLGYWISFSSCLIQMNHNDIGYNMCIRSRESTIHLISENKNLLYHRVQEAVFRKIWQSVITDYSWITVILYHNRDKKSMDFVKSVVPFQCSIQSLARSTARCQPWSSSSRFSGLLRRSSTYLHERECEWSSVIYH